jgi:hypothetical protein
MEVIETPQLIICTDIDAKGIWFYRFNKTTKK